MHFFQGHNTELRPEEGWLPIDFGGVVMRKVLRSSGLFLKMTGVDAKDVKASSISLIHCVRCAEEANQGCFYNAPQVTWLGDRRVLVKLRIVKKLVAHVPASPT